MSTTLKTKPAVQLVLGSQAIAFPLKITVSKLDGTEAVFTLTCKALRKTQWAQARDEYHASVLQGIKATVATAAATADADTDEATPALGDKLHTMVTRGLQTDADLVLQFATAWDLADDLTAANLQALEDEFGGTLRQIINAFETAIYQGRLGN